MTPEAAWADVLIMDAEEKWMIRAKLLNVSHSGGLVCPGRLVSTGRRLSLLLERIPEAGWIDADVVRSEGRNEAGLRFVTALSTEFLRALASDDRGRRYDADSKTPYLGDFMPDW
jgi:hypothetical protein